MLALSPDLALALSAARTVLPGGLESRKSGATAMAAARGSTNMNLFGEFEMLCMVWTSLNRLPGFCERRCGATSVAFF